MAISRSPVVQQTIEVKYLTYKKDIAFKWSIINGALFALLACDLFHKCPYYYPLLNYIEYICTLIFGINSLYHVIRYLYFKMKICPVAVTPNQKKLLGFKDSDKSFQLISPDTTRHSLSDTEQSPGLSLSMRSWASNSSVNMSHLSGPSTSWLYKRGSPTTLPPKPANLNFSGSDCIADEESLHDYLRKYEESEKVSSYASNLESSPRDRSNFWSHPSTRGPFDLSPLFRKTFYQLAPLNSTQTTSTGNDEGSPSSMQKSPQVWRRVKLEPQQLTQWNANLRLWISSTILDRLVKEIKNIDEALLKHGLSDMRIGYVGIERLKKTAQTSHVIQYIPTLPVLVPFLEISSNQEYVVQRIKDLYTGGMSEYRWNGGGTLNNKNWDESLPTDSQLIMHFIATYLDTQLLPITHSPDCRPFTVQHFCKTPEKPQKSADALIIHQTSVTPPHFVLIQGEETFEVPKGRNNLLHTIILFLHFVATKHHGMLGRVNLGRSGVNILWVIDR